VPVDATGEADAVFERIVLALVPHLERLSAG
jgi:hypothetical protein